MLSMGRQCRAAGCSTLTCKPIYHAVVPRVHSVRVRPARGAAPQGAHTGVAAGDIRRACASANTRKSFSHGKSDSSRTCYLYETHLVLG